MVAVISMDYPGIQALFSVLEVNQAAQLAGWLPPRGLALE
jgi:hypothetical protein